VKLSENVMHFGRVLRGAGMPVGPDRVIDALRALDAAGIQRRDDVYWTLASVLLDRREQFELYDHAFNLFWQGRAIRPGATAADDADSSPASAKALANRLAEAFAAASRVSANPRPAEVETDATATASPVERLRHADFNSMSMEELAQVRKLIAHLRLPIPSIATRRMRPDSSGERLDPRATLRASLRGGSDAIVLRRRSRVMQHPPLVVLCDVSGSMDRYARMFLHFLHAITNDRDRVSTFVFGTRLTNITRQLRHRDVDVALRSAAAVVADWSGGTRIGSTVKEFNLRWSRRVLGQNAVVLLISDGLDREGGEELPLQMERLRKSCRKLIWLNPLLRYAGFEPLARGVREMLPHVDAFLPVHNLDSLTTLSRALSETQTSLFTYPGTQKCK
jgi:uncharacterized protein with von Willebrand factor type A (vWA) domain